MAEAGVPGLEVYSWQAFVAPKGLPKDVNAKLTAALVGALKDPEVTKKFNDIGFDVVANSPAEFRTFLDAELARWKQVVDAGGIKQTD
jgi:tripartite-type tricarboxylate transporter receptor subunit TctC